MEFVVLFNFSVFFVVSLLIKLSNPQLQNPQLPVDFAKSGSGVNWNQEVTWQIDESTIVLQNMNGVCNSIWNPTVRYLQDLDEYLVLSQATEQTFYERDKNCVVTLIGKVGWQWSMTVNTFDVEGTLGEDSVLNKCPDFLKIYDAERCDNSKLLKGINYDTGLCGTLSESVIGNLRFTTCANKLTFQFKTDLHQSFQRGFSIELVQYPWQNPTGGPDCDPSLNGIAAGVWRDGTFSEFQNTWNEQPIIPGYVPVGAETDYDKELNGIKCYACLNCPVEPFDPKRDGTAEDTNCYMCSKEWDEEYQIARRKCYSRADYLNQILSIKGIDDPFLGCRQVVDEFSRTVNHCFCDTDFCNTGVRQTYSVLALVLALLTRVIQIMLL